HGRSFPLETLQIPKKLKQTGVRMAASGAPWTGRTVKMSTRLSADAGAMRAGVHTISETRSVLVAIASYGTKQDHFLERVVAEFRRLPMPTRVVVLSDRPKPAFGAEVVAGLPSRNTY